MNKEELVDAIAARTKLTKKDSCKALESMIVAVSSSLRRGYPVQLTGFGSLEVHQHKARSWRSRSGKTITIPAHKTVFFHPGVDLKEMINE